REWGGSRRPIHRRVIHAIVPAQLGLRAKGRAYERHANPIVGFPDVGPSFEGIAREWGGFQERCGRHSIHAISEHRKKTYWRGVTSPNRADIDCGRIRPYT